MRNKLQKIGENIRERREILGLLQPELSAISGVSIRTIQLVENGKGNPSIETLMKIADPLGLQLDLSLKEPASMD